MKRLQEMTYVELYAEMAELEMQREKAQEIIYKLQQELNTRNNKLYGDILNKTKIKEDKPK